MIDFLYIWIKTLGAKPEGLTNRQADISAFLRTLYVVLNVVTCGFIVAGNTRNWGWWGAPPITQIVVTPFPFQPIIPQQ
jgi:hypothetical protein